MKKFLAIVMCLAMALSMMTVVSFAADTDYYIGANGEVTVAPGEVVDIPVYVLGPGKAEYTIETMAAVVYEAPADLTFEVVAGAIDAGSISVEGTTITVMKDSAATMSLTAPAFTIKVTAPETEGTYTFTVDPSATGVFDADWSPYANIVLEDIVINVEAAEVKPEATIIATPTVAPNGGVVKVLQFANATEFGIKYTGSDADWAGQEFPSLATTGTIAAVEVVGLDDSFVAYAK